MSQFVLYFSRPPMRRLRMEKRQVTKSFNPIMQSTGELSAPLRRKTNKFNFKLLRAVYVINYV